MSRPTKVYILGAGCSVCGGYPVASAVTEKLLNFANTRLLHDEAKELRRCTTETCARMKQLDVETIDQLAERLYQEKGNEIPEAKLAMSAFFFSIEDESVVRAKSIYASFFEELFRFGSSELLEDRAKETPCRVITYNYDRLFERAFIEWAKRQNQEPTNNLMKSGLDDFVKKILNMGIRFAQEIRFEPDRFTFLKVHGGIGQFNRNNDGGMNHIYWPDFGEEIPKLNDVPFYKRKGYEIDNSTIIFPSDKKRRARLPNSDSFRAYMDGLENQARGLCRLASEIHIVGYSIQPVDYFSFKAMIAVAKECKRIVIRNRADQESILVRRLEGLKEEFGTDWKIEFRAEDFFQM